MLFLFNVIRISDETLLHAKRKSKFHLFNFIDDLVDIIRYSVAVACNIIKQPVKVFIKVFRKHMTIFLAQLYQAFSPGCVCLFTANSTSK